MGTKVSFIIAGTQKGGTTALYSYLKEHPKLYMPKTKELHFFDNETIEWAKPNYNLYHKHFENSKSKERIWGEATPIYMYWKQSAVRIKNYNEKIRLIIILRNPITRAYSHWNMENKRNMESLSFIDAVKNEKTRCLELENSQHRVYSYVDRGFYCKQLTNLWNYIKKEQILIIRNEELRNEPTKTLAKIYAHIEIDPIKQKPMNNVFHHPYNEPMPNEAKQVLLEIFYEEIKNLEQLLGWDCNEWFLI